LVTTFVDCVDGLGLGTTWVPEQAARRITAAAVSRTRKVGRNIG
jgi:hypothetical protein